MLWWTAAYVLHSQGKFEDLTTSLRMAAKRGHIEDDIKGEWSIVSFRIVIHSMWLLCFVDRAKQIDALDW
jgi:hypothetical protein